MLVDGLHVNVWPDIFSGYSGLYFDQLQGRGRRDATPATTEFTGNDRLNVEPDIYDGYSAGVYVHRTRRVQKPRSEPYDHGVRR